MTPRWHWDRISMTTDHVPGKLILACALGIATACTAPLPMPTPAPEPPTPLGPVRLARVQAAYDNLGGALAAWRFHFEKPDCLLLFAERDEWLLGCEDLFTNDGFIPTGETRDAQIVRWNRRSFLFDGKLRPYDDIKLTLVAQVVRYADEKAQVDRPVLVMQEWDALHAHHPGFQHDSLEFWLASFVHESFHSQQGRYARVRAMSDRDRAGGLAGPKDLEAFYRQNAGFRAAVTSEYDLLRAASTDPALDAAKAKAALGAWLALSRQRAATFAAALERAYPGQHALEKERYLIFLEGSARYVEASFLTHPADATIAPLASEPTFQRFAASRGRQPAELPGLGNLGANYFYTLGMYLCLLLDHADPGWKQHLFDDDGFLVAAVERAAS